jgi:hypothetical protein
MHRRQLPAAAERGAPRCACALQAAAPAGQHAFCSPRARAGAGAGSGCTAGGDSSVAGRVELRVPLGAALFGLWAVLPERQGLVSQDCGKGRGGAGPRHG